MFKIIAFVILLLSYLYNRKNIEDTPDELKYLPYEISGNYDSNVLLIFLHGYPNSFRMWDEMIEKLKEDYLCLNLSYPNFSNKVIRKWGIDILEIIKLIPETINYIDSNNKYKKVFVSHDWGSVFSYLVDNFNKNYIDDLISIDVGPGVEEEIYTFYKTASYQTYLAGNFLIGGLLGDYLTNSFIKSINPYGILQDELNILNSSINYPYFYLWKNIFYYKNLFKNYTPSCSIAYVYGKNKSFMFHTEKFLNLLRNETNSEVHEVNDGHWVMRNNKDFLIDLINKRIKLKITNK